MNDVETTKEFKRTGTHKCTQVTTIGHILAHIENARNFFEIKSNYWGGTTGFDYDKRFPDYINHVVRDIDIKYSVNQDRMYRFVTPVEADYATDDDYIGSWPVYTYDYSAPGPTHLLPKFLADDERQVDTWISNFRYMLHDAMVSYIYAVGERGDKNRMICEYTDDELKSMACDLANWKSSSREDEQRYYRKQSEVPQWKIDWLLEHGWLRITIDDSGTTIDLMKIGSHFEDVPKEMTEGETLKDAINNLYDVVSKA